jgi:hypothetical protein
MVLPVLSLLLSRCNCCSTSFGLDYPDSPATCLGCCRLAPAPAARIIIRRVAIYVIAIQIILRL